MTSPTKTIHQRLEEFKDRLSESEFALLSAHGELYEKLATRQKMPQSEKERRFWMDIQPGSKDPPSVAATAWLKFRVAEQLSIENAYLQQARRDRLAENEKLRAEVLALAKLLVKPIRHQPTQAFTVVLSPTEERQLFTLIESGEPDALRKAVLILSNLRSVKTIPESTSEEIAFQQYLQQRISELTPPPPPEPYEAASCNACSRSPCICGGYL